MISRIDLENLQKENEMIKQNISNLTDEINNIKDIIRAIKPGNKYRFDLDVPSNKKEYKYSNRSTKLVELRTKLTAKRGTPGVEIKSVKPHDDGLETDHGPSTSARVSAKRMKLSKARENISPGGVNIDAATKTVTKKRKCKGRF